MYLVAGLGITGQSVLRYFASQGEPCFAYDTRANFDTTELQHAFPDIQFAVGELPTDWLSHFETIVLSPGIAQSDSWVVGLKSIGKQVIGDIELFARSVGVPVIGITGSNGKSTVTTITGLVLERAGYQVGVGGNIGAPVLDLLLDDKEYDIYVLELSSFQLETTYSLQTVAATVLNISEDHMDRYAALEDYIQVKTKVFECTDLAVIPQGFELIGVMPPAHISYFGVDSDIERAENDYGLLIKDDQAWLAKGQQSLVSVKEMALQGKHHQLNALAMMALCQPFEVKPEHFSQVLSTFKGLAHRTQSVGCFAGVEWINDSKGTNVGATLTAIESVGGQSLGKLILIAGGVGKDADFFPLKHAVSAYCKHTILYGRDQLQIASALEGLEYSCVETLADAIELASHLALAQECVLFSPACASFDQFANYAQRGDIFKELVLQHYQGEGVTPKC